MYKGNSSSEIGILGILQIVFLVLKITNLIDWSWGIVLSPMIINISLSVLILLILWIED